MTPPVGSKVQGSAVQGFSGSAVHGSKVQVLAWSLAASSDQSTLVIH
jgi:hypothetical protein